METFPVSIALCKRDSPHKEPVMRSLNIFFLPWAYLLLKTVEYIILPWAFLLIKTVAGDLISGVKTNIIYCFDAMTILELFYVWWNWKYKNNTETEMWSGWLLRSPCYTTTNNCDLEPRVKCLWLYLSLSHHSVSVNNSYWFNRGPEWSYTYQISVFSDSFEISYRCQWLEADPTHCSL